jgi:hypothetical protein
MLHLQEEGCMYSYGIACFRYFGISVLCISFVPTSLGHAVA